MIIESRTLNFLRPTPSRTAMIWVGAVTLVETIIPRTKKEKEYDTTISFTSYSPMALEQQQQLTFDFDTTKDHHISKRPKLNEDDLLEDDDAQENNAVDAAVDFALQMLARDQRRVGNL